MHLAAAAAATSRPRRCIARAVVAALLLLLPAVRGSCPFAAVTDAGVTAWCTSGGCAWGAQLQLSLVGMGDATTANVTVNFTGAAGATWPCASVSVVASPPGFTCTISLLPTAMFGVQLGFALASPACGVPYTPQLAYASVVVAQPFLTDAPTPVLLAVSGGSMLALSLPHARPAVSDWTSAGLAAPASWNAISVYVNGATCAVPSLDRLVSVNVPAGEGRNLRLTVEMGGLYNLTSDGAAPNDSMPVYPNASQYIAYRAPAFTAVSPATITLPAPSASFASLGAARFRTLTLSGTNLALPRGNGTNWNSRIGTAWIGGVACGNLIALNASMLLCAGWDVTAFVLADTTALTTPLSLDILATWLDTNVSAHALLAVLPRPVVSYVAPLAVQSGDTVIVYGNWFIGDTSCGACNVKWANVSVTIGGTPCTSVTTLSQYALLCIAPTVSAAVAGYPLLPVVVTAPGGLASQSALTVVYPEQLGVTMNISYPGQSFALPSGSSTNTLNAFEPPLVLQLSGVGEAVCWLDVSSGTSGGGVTTGVGLGLADASLSLVGTTSVKTNLGAVRSSGVVTFDNVGVKGPANSSVWLVANCQDSRGVVITVSTLYFVQLAGLSADWSSAAYVSLAQQQTPTPLSPIDMQFTWLGVPGNIVSSDDVPQCQATLFAPAVAPPLNVALSEVSRSGLSTAAASVSITNATRIDMTFTSLSLASASLDSTVTAVAECVWQSTGERVRLPSLTLTLVSAAVVWGVPGAVASAGSGISARTLLDVTPLTTSMLVNVSSSTTLETASATCHIVSLNATGLKLSTIAAVTVVPSVDNGVVAGGVVSQVEGGMGVTSVFRAECTLWGMVVASSPVAITTTILSLATYGTLPTRFLPSDGTAQFPVTPAFSAAVLDGNGHVLTNTSCTLTSVTLTAVVQLSGDATQLLSDTRGIVNVSNWLIKSGFASDDTVTIQLSCKRVAGNAPPAVQWNVSMIALSMEVCTRPVAIMQSQSTMPTWVVGIDTQTTEACGTGAHAAPDFEVPTILCSLESDTQRNGNRTLFVEGSAVTVDQATLLATFNALKMTGEQGETYYFRVACTIASITLPTPATITVTIQGCAAGSEATGPFCTACPDNTYSIGGVGQPCRGCPTEGVTCSNGIITLTPQFFRPADQVLLPLDTSSQLLPCYNSEACIVNQTDMMYSCSEGYTGALCGVCIPGYASFSGLCRPCWTPTQDYILLGCLYALFLALTAFLALRKPSGTASPPSTALRIILGFLQAIAALHVFKKGGTSAFRSMMGWTSFISESPLSSGAIQCAMGWSYIYQYGLTVTLPWMVIAGTIVMYAILSAAHACCVTRNFTLARWRSILAAYWRAGRPASTTMLVLFVGYMPIVSASLKVMDCYEHAIDSVWYLRSDLGVECGVGQHVIARSLAFAILMAYGVGYPVSIFVLLRRANRDKLADTHFKSAFGFVYDGYRVGKAKMMHWKRMISGGHMVWWESVILVRKMGIVFLAVLVQDPFYQVVGATLWLSMFFGLQQRFHPYDASLFNFLEALVLADLFLTVSVSTLLLKSTLTDDTDPSPSIADTLVTVFLVFINMGTLATLVAYFVKFSCQHAQATAKTLVQRKNTFKSASAPATPSGTTTSISECADSSVVINTSHATKDGLLVSGGEMSVSASAALSPVGMLTPQYRASTTTAIQTGSASGNAVASGDVTSMVRSNPMHDGSGTTSNGIGASGAQRNVARRSMFFPTLLRASASPHGATQSNEANSSEASVAANGPLSSAATTDSTDTNTHDTTSAPGLGRLTRQSVMSESRSRMRDMPGVGISSRTLTLQQGGSERASVPALATDSPPHASTLATLTQRDAAFVLPPPPPSLGLPMVPPLNMNIGTHTMPAVTARSSGFLGFGGSGGGGGAAVTVTNPFTHRSTSMTADTARTMMSTAPLINPRITADTSGVACAVLTHGAHSDVSTAGADSHTSDHAVPRQLIPYDTTSPKLQPATHTTPTVPVLTIPVPPSPHAIILPGPPPGAPTETPRTNTAAHFLLSAPVSTPSARSTDSIATVTNVDWTAGIISRDGAAVLPPPPGTNTSSGTRTNTNATSAPFL